MPSLRPSAATPTPPFEFVEPNQTVGDLRRSADRHQPLAAGGCLVGDLLPKQLADSDIELGEARLKVFDDLVQLGRAGRVAQDVGDVELQRLGDLVEQLDAAACSRTSTVSSCSQSRASRTDARPRRKPPRPAERGTFLLPDRVRRGDPNRLTKRWRSWWR
jgi:hypothetical protein